MAGLVLLVLMLAASFGAGYAFRADISRRRRAKYLERMAYRQATGQTLEPRERSRAASPAPALLSNLTPPGRPQSSAAGASPMRPSIRQAGTQYARSTAG
jgi:hypothetical protein